MGIVASTVIMGLLMATTTLSAAIAHARNASVPLTIPQDWDTAAIPYPPVNNCPTIPWVTQAVRTTLPVPMQTGLEHQAIVVTVISPVLPRGYGAGHIAWVTSHDGTWGPPVTLNDPAADIPVHFGPLDKLKAAPANCIPTNAHSTIELEAAVTEHPFHQKGNALGWSLGPAPTGTEDERPEISWRPEVPSSIWLTETSYHAEETFTGSAVEEFFGQMAGVAPELVPPHDTPFYQQERRKTGLAIAIIGGILGASILASWIWYCVWKSPLMHRRRVERERNKAKTMLHQRSEQERKQQVLTVQQIRAAIAEAEAAEMRGESLETFGISGVSRSSSDASDSDTKSTKEKPFREAKGRPPTPLDVEAILPADRV